MSKPKVLLWDIETTWGLRPDLTHLLCIGWKWLGEKKVHISKISDNGNWPNPKGLRDDRHILREFSEAFSEADDVVTWYGIKFDEPYLRARLAKYRMKTLPHVHHTDLWKTCRKEFSLASNRLENCAEFLGVEHEKEKLSHFVWQDAQYGNKKQLNRIVYRCKVDVLLLEDVYEVMLPYIRTSRYNKAAGRGLTCPGCGVEGKLQRRGYQVALTNRWIRYHCQECGSWSRAPEKHPEKVR
jgi:uncharacterized protein YprB with RNaseH-like and TPR domain